MEYLSVSLGGLLLAIQISAGGLAWQTIRGFRETAVRGWRLILMGFGLVTVGTDLFVGATLFGANAFNESAIAFSVLLLLLSGGAVLLLGVWRELSLFERPSSGDERFASLANVAADAIITIDEDSRILSWNRCAETLFGKSAQAMVGQKLHAIIPERYRRAHDDGVTRICRNGGNPFGGLTRELHALRQDGSEFPIELTVSTWMREGNRLFVGIIRDITDRKRLEAELRRLATTDPLTGLHNRRHFLEAASQELLRASRLQHSLALVMLDIDHFKRINDTFGHAAGDEALKGLARVCLDSVREIDVVGRLGGEEFAILLPETGRDGAIEVAERLRQDISDLTIETAHGVSVRFTSSLGVATVGGGQGIITPEHLLALADEALYQAKHEGRDCVRWR